MTHSLPDFSLLSQSGPPAPVKDTSGLLGEYMAYYDLSRCLPLVDTVYSGMIEAGSWTLWSQVWCPPAPRGTVFVVHGYFDHLGLYGHLLETLLRAQWQVVLWDLPGHGLSNGARASIDAFDDYVGCLRVIRSTLNERDLAPKPWSGIGQSTGSAILATDALSDPETPWQSLCLLAPLVRPLGWNQSRWLHSALKPFVRTLKRKFRANSNDQHFARFLHHDDPLQPAFLSVSWVSAMRLWMADLKALPPSPMPTLILQGTQDLTVDWQYNLPMLERKFPNAQTVCHDRARHHLVNELPDIRTPLFDRLVRFIDAPPTAQEAAS
ncbi:alpha/beta hydrolase [Larsenimonas salina]|uniref:alpha/beta hydrolase n=1 Tax=Larsenimonas salina TaxID=1295565 RepID=UPI00207344D4|nr:alpha/beta hydrolase [Larsenimonas salina]MCM5704194.1 alpha/beta hydrolase [Larsenimonas salina]